MMSIACIRRNIIISSRCVITYAPFEGAGSNGLRQHRYYSSSAPGNHNKIEQANELEVKGIVGTRNSSPCRSMMRGQIINLYIPNGTGPSDSDYATFDRQQEHHMARDVSVVDKSRCRHGRCRAFLRFPVNIGGAVDSGMTRLSCPYLVKAVDELEAEGKILALNDELLAKPKLTDSFIDTNEVYSKIRIGCTSAVERDEVVRRFGAEAAAIFFASGIIGVSPNKVSDIKCMHAHLADGIMRGFDKNLIAAMVVEMLEERGISLQGGERKYCYNILLANVLRNPLYIVHFYNISVSVPMQPIGP